MLRRELQKEAGTCRSEDSKLGHVRGRSEHPRVVMEAMRHSDIKLTMKLYTEAKQLPVAAAMKRLPWYRSSGDSQKEATG